MISIVVIFLAACNQGSQTASQTKTDTTVGPEKLAGEKKYDQRFPGIFENIRETNRKLFLDGKRPDTAFMSSPLHLFFAKEYVQNFSKNKPLVSGGAEAMSPYFDFNDTTLQAFSDLYKAGKIDGIRVYMAKYTGNELDFRNAGLTRYTVIMVGTKDSSGIPVDQFIPSDKNPDLMVSVQDYTNPCTPSPCPTLVGAKLLRN